MVTSTIIHANGDGTCRMEERKSLVRKATAETISVKPHKMAPPATTTTSQSNAARQGRSKTHERHIRYRQVGTNQR